MHLPLCFFMKLLSFYIQGNMVQVNKKILHVSKPTFPCIFIPVSGLSFLALWCLSLGLEIGGKFGRCNPNISERHHSEMKEFNTFVRDEIIHK